MNEVMNGQDSDRDMWMTGVSQCMAVRT